MISVGFGAAVAKVPTCWETVVAVAAIVWLAPISRARSVPVGMGGTLGGGATGVSMNNTARSPAVSIWKTFGATLVELQSDRREYSTSSSPPLLRTQTMAPESGVNAPPRVSGALLKVQAAVVPFQRRTRRSDSCVFVSYAVT